MQEQTTNPAREVRSLSTATCTCAWFCFLKEFILTSWNLQKRCYDYYIKTRTFQLFNNTWEYIHKGLHLLVLLCSVDMLGKITGNSVKKLWFTISTRFLIIKNSLNYHWITFPRWVGQFRQLQQIYTTYPVEEW